MLALSSEQLDLAAFVQKTDGSRYIGAHFARFKNNIYLVGTFQVDRQQLDCSGISVELPLNNKKSILNLIKKIASKKEIKIEIREPIEMLLQNGEKTYTTECFMHFSEDKVDDCGKIFSKKRNLIELIG
jgi:hypothetical protein